MNQEVRRPPTVTEGGHDWIPGEGVAVCRFNCGAWYDEVKAPQDITAPPHFCPANPAAEGRFRLVSPMKATDRIYCSSPTTP